MGDKNRIVFMGTPEFAVPSLEAVLDAGYDVAAVVTQPDRPRGRGRKVSQSPVKEYAARHNLRVLEPLKIREEGFIDGLESLAPDFIVVVAYGRILPAGILEIPNSGCINVHASLLPRYRGAAPISWAIIRGDKETGVTTMLMDEGMDTGPMLLREKVSIEDNETAGDLSKRLAIVGAEVLLRTLRLLEEGKIDPKPQDDKLATYAPILNKEDGRIDFSKGASDVANLVRGLNPWPGAYTTRQGRTLKVHRARPLDDSAGPNLKDIRPGTVVDVSEGSIKIKCNKGVLEIIELQAEGKKTMSAGEFLRGHRVERGEVFG